MPHPQMGIIVKGDYSVRFR